MNVKMYTLGQYVKFLLNDFAKIQDIIIVYVFYIFHGASFILSPNP